MKKLMRCAVAIATPSLVVLESVAGTLTGTFTSIPANAAVNLTTEGTLDWVHWGLFTETSVDRKGGVTPQISDFIPVDSSNGYVFVYQYADNWNGYSWGDGAPHMTITNTPTGVWAYGTPAVGSGFRITAPASTNLQTLKVYVGAFNALGRFVASLSDNSATEYINPVNQAVNNVRNGPSAVYALNYAADSPAQTLTVTYTLEQLRGADGNVTLQSAALTAPGANNLPFITITNPANDISVMAPTNVTITAIASDVDGFISLVEFYAGTNKIGEASTSPYTFTWTNPPPGNYTITARATDDDGGCGISGPVNIFVSGGGGNLSVARATPPAAVNLASEGTSDWAHWGLISASNFNHKVDGGSQVVNFTRIGTNRVQRFTDNYTGFSWSDGTPVTATNNATIGVYITGVTNGFEISAPADTTPRTLRVYAGLYGAQGKFQAYLSDFSANAFTDTSVTNRFGNSYNVYTLSYAAARSGQRVVVRYIVLNLFDFDFGNVTLSAATLQGPASTSIRLRNPKWDGSQFTFWFASEAGRSYSAQSVPSLSASNWQTFTNFSAIGATTFVTNAAAPGFKRFYRVLVP